MSNIIEDYLKRANANLGRRKPKAKTNYQLTSLGRTKAEENAVLSPARIQVMDALMNAPCTVPEIARIARMAPERTSRVVESLIADGWATRTGAENF